MSETQTGGVSDDPGRIIYELEKKLEAANAQIDRLRTELQQTQQWRTAATDAHSQSEALRIDAQAEIDRLRIELQETYAGWSDSNSALAEQTVEIDRLKAELQTEFTAAQQLRSENESLAVRLQRAEVAAAEALQRWETTEQMCLKIITALAGVRS